jgi:16S rRNA (cytosine967-C5)-methyltransferase
VKSLERLRSVPWHALAGFDAVLGPALEQVLAGTAADRVLDRLLRKHRDASAEQRNALAEAVFGVGLWRRRLRAGRPDAPPLTLLRALVDGTPEPAAFADRHSLPDWLAEIIVRAPGPDELADELNSPGPIFLRANTLCLTRDELAARLADEGVQTTPGRWGRDCLVIVSPRPNLYGLKAWNEGLFEVQDEGSQLLGELVDLKPGDEVLDLCAGAGGKTLQLCAQLKNEGRVHAVDVDLARLERLRTRATRAHARCISIHGRAVPDSLRVSHVLVDAPCSELGALRRGPDLRWRIEPASFEPLPSLQRELLEVALHHLRPGGRLVYATCTFRPEENEEVVRTFEQKHPELSRVRPQVDSRVLEGDFLKLWPHHHGTDAFFAAVHLKPQIET